MIFVVFFIILVFLMIWSIPYANKERDDMQRRASEYRKKSNGKPFCPKCGCTELSANKKGYSMVTGTIGSKDVYITCMKCGHRWKAGAYKSLY